MKKFGKVFVSLLLLMLTVTVLVSCAASNSSWLRGIDAPDASWGKNGDMYLDIDDGDLYNKVNGAWTKVGNLVGPAGTSGQHGHDGIGITNAEVVKGELVFTLSNGEKLNSGKVTGDSNYEISIEDGVLSVLTKRTFENLDSIAFGNKTFRDIFEKNNILKSGNLFDSDKFNTWDTKAGSTNVTGEYYTSKPSSLSFNALTGCRNIKTLRPEDKGLLYIGSQVNVVRHAEGYVGVFARIGGTDVTDGMFKRVNNQFKVASQIVEYGNSSFEIVMGTTEKASLQAYIDSAVVLNLSKIFGGDQLPTKEELDDLLTVYVKMFNGEKNVTLYKSYSSKHVEEEIPRNEARERWFDAVYKKAQQLNLTLEREGIDSAIGLNNFQITLEDLCKIGIAATGYEELQKIWNQNQYVTVSQGNVHTMAVESAILNHRFIKEFTDYYYILGNKGGMLNNTESDKTRTTRTLILEVEGPDGSTMVLATYDDQVGVEGCNRMTNAKILMDIAVAKYKDRNADVKELEQKLTSKAAVAVVLPKSGHVFNYASYDWFGPDSKYCLYNKEGEMKIKTASTWKTMTAITALDYITDLDERLYVHEEDISSVASKPVFYGGEIVTYRDCLYFMMLPSSNVAPNVIARNVGEMLIRKGI